MADYRGLRISQLIRRAWMSATVTPGNSQLCAGCVVVMSLSMVRNLTSRGPLQHWKPARLGLHLHNEGADWRAQRGAHHPFENWT